MTNDHKYMPCTGDKVMMISFANWLAKHFEIKNGVYVDSEGQEALTSYLYYVWLNSEAE